ncbi:MAG TPA: S-adenosylmethionine:tRNA ribosyltransferase-isomerase [Chloroflexota bacterium]|nr:S-adenosylmethionine:tRNA ribosyltransferase-isomerase [Chloroflexota bacterium]
MLAIASLDFELPATLEAHEPPEARGVPRDGVRLLVTAEEGARVEHRVFRELPDVLQPGDVLVANDSATLVAAVTGRRQDGSAVDVHFSTRLPAGLWVVEPRRIQASADERLELPGDASLQLVARYPESERLWIACADFDVLPYLERWGRPISYPYVPERWPLKMYQTVYAGPPGSAEMPSAGRAFTPDVLERLAHRGIQFHTLTLHTGVASLEGHERPYAEEYWVPHATATAVNEAKADGRRVIAVGTTVVRALESAVDEGDGQVIAAHAWTDLMVTPERGVRVVDSLLTGFHEPKASHLAMLEAIAGREHLERAYAAALGGGYLWHEFGDLHLILARKRHLDELTHPYGIVGCVQDASPTLFV